MNHSPETTLAPLMLMRRDGTWSLRMQRMVALGPALYRPRDEEICGAETIARHLEWQLREAALHREAVRLFEKDAEADADCAFVASEGRWMPADPEPTPVKGRESEPVVASSVQVAGMEATLQRLVQRVDWLENLVSALSKKLATASAAAQAAPAAQPAVAQAAEAPREASSEAEAAPVKAAADAEPDFPELKLPEAVQIGELVSDVTFEAVTAGALDEPAWPLSEAPPGTHMAELGDEQGRVLARVLLDGAAICRIGGAMLGEEEDAIAGQIEAGEPSSDSVDAAAELINTLSGALNRIKGNARVRGAALTPFDSATAAGLSARTRRDFRDSGGGTLVLMAV
ncbi:MAG: hypothetical protein OEZ06_29505 [Myxococcales bacterium]|nr:hypothetical protein [Myxococcales bacterium]